MSSKEKSVESQPEGRPLPTMPATWNPTCRPQKTRQDPQPTEKVRLAQIVPAWSPVS